MLHSAIGRFYKSELVDPGKGAHRADEGDVRPFRCLDRTNWAIVRRVYVAHFEGCQVPAQTARSECGQSALVSQLGKRIRLIHELAQLRTPKEISNHRAESLRVDQLLRSHAVDVHIEERHTFLHETLGSRQTNAALVREQLANRTHPTAAEMVDVIQYPLTLPQRDEILHCSDKIFLRQRPLGEINFNSKLLIDLVPANSTEIVFF